MRLVEILGIQHCDRQTDTHVHTHSQTHTHTHACTHTQDLSTCLYVSSIECLHMTSLSINNQLLCDKYEKKCVIRRCTMKVKLQTDCCDRCGVLLLCLQLYHHGFQDQSQKHARFLEIKFYQFPQNVLIIGSTFRSALLYRLIVSSHHTWLQPVLNIH